MQKVEIILLPFATKRLPRHFNLSKLTIFSVILSLLTIFVIGAYVVLDQATNVIHHWQLANLNKDHQQLLTSLGILKSKAIQFDQELSEKDNSLEFISLITETELTALETPQILNKSITPWDESGNTANDYILTQMFSLKSSENTSAKKFAAVDAALDRLESHIDFHERWVAQCTKDMEEKYNRWARIPTVVPFDGVLTCRFGERRSPFGGPRVERHGGVDIAGPIGMPLKAAADGVVLFANGASGYGNLVIIDHENGLYSYYGHCSLLKVVEGQRVKRYQTVALLGNTGRSTGPHLHFEIREGSRPVNPLEYVDINAD